VGDKRPLKIKRFLDCSRTEGRHRTLSLPKTRSDVVDNECQVMPREHRLHFSEAGTRLTTYATR
jgi:hypothetical protein